MRTSVLILLVIFNVQVFDVPPVLKVSNPKTCCGRAVCLCRHAKGEFCAIRNGQNQERQQAALHHKSCHFHTVKMTTKKTQTIKSSRRPTRGIAFTKEPCAAEVPKSVLPQYAKDFLFPSSAGNFLFIQEGTIPSGSSDVLLLLREHGIYRPPRTFSFPL